MTGMAQAATKIANMMCSLVREHILIREHILAENREINDSNGAGSNDNCENDALCLFPTLDPAWEKKLSH
jgi:hypothetical protein